MNCHARQLQCSICRCTDKCSDKVGFIPCNGAVDCSQEYAVGDDKLIVEGAAVNNLLHSTQACVLVEVPHRLWSPPESDVVRKHAHASSCNAIQSYCKQTHMAFPYQAT
ncbi:hypothetical protein ABBQ38_012807 [Trebouxia sp. C0009 RCD-2024]